MRNINKKNKITFSLFIVAILAIIALVIFLFLAGDKLKAIQFDVNKDNLIFTNEGNVVKVNGDGIVKENWNNNYYFNKKDLGKVPIIYNQKINLLGSAFEIKLDGNVEFLKDKNTFDFSTEKFIKVDDRQYLIISPEIRTSSDILLSNFAIIQIDKNGSAKIINNKMDFKTIEPIQLTFNGNQFNTGSEKLNSSVGSEVDLTKINGTTNEFISLDNSNVQEQKKSGETNNEVSSSSEPNNTNQAQGNSQNDNPKVSLSLPSLEDLKKIFSKENDPVNNIESYLRINNSKSGLTSISINYFVSDISNKYSNVFLEISDGNKIENINLSKSQTTYDIFNLIPNTQYKISLGYISSGEKTIVDTRNVKTQDFNSYLKINEITKNSISVNARIDENIYVDSGSIILLADNEVISKVNFDITLINTKQGDNLTLDIPEEFSEREKYTLEFSDIKYQGQELKLEKSIVVRNPFIKNFIIKFFEKIF